MIMSRQIHWIAAALTALLIQGCATGAQVRVDYDQKTDFQTLRSYAWAPMTEEERQEKSRNSLTHERIQSAIDAHLATRGYAKVGEAQADFLVTHTVTVERRTQVQETRASVGYGRYGAHGGVGVGYGIPVETSTYQYKVGTLIIDIIDARQKRLVWRGSGERTLGEDQTPEKRTEIINATVNEILSRFPPASNKPK
jgi:Domain of unknown function (DUF4136)